MAAGDPTQITPVQIMHIFVLYCSVQIALKAILISVRILLHGVY